jgi:hypothetical protein
VSSPLAVYAMLSPVFIMEIQINRNEERLTVNKITVFVGNKEFEIEIDKFGELLITKEQYGNEESGLIVRPKVSNVIGVS